MQPPGPGTGIVAALAMSHRLVHLLVALALGGVLVGASAAAASSPNGLQGRVSSAQNHEKSLRGSINADTIKINGFQGRLDDLIKRLAGIQASLDSERSQLQHLQSSLRGSRAHLAILRARLQQGLETLKAQLVANYESPQPDAVSVIFNAHGFSDLLDRVEGLKRIQQRNVEAINAVKAQRGAVSAETTRLRGLTERQQHLTAATLVQRNEAASLKDAVLAHQLHFKRARAKKAGTLASVRSARQALQHRLDKLISAGGFASHGGAFGFFPAAGTNYAPGDEPTLAARLDRMARALQLHLIGLSGYRTPQHSLEVGGFADDPHTHGEASDTPGVEGIPEATLNRFGLTRPFGGAAEADHIQLAGSAK
jgi:peptidoglycan hydrolase CwlO-like protein